MGVNWTHAQCEQCWFDHNMKADGSMRLPVSLNNAGIETCCDCGSLTFVGIFVRADGKTLDNCGGHEDS